MGTIDIALVLSILSAIGVISSVYMNYRKHKNEDIQSQTAIDAGFVKLNIKLDQSCADIRDVARNVEKLTDENRRLSEVVIQHSEQIKTLFDRVAKLEKDR